MLDGLQPPLTLTCPRGYNLLGQSLEFAWIYTCASVVVLRKLPLLVNSMSTKSNMTFLLGIGYGVHMLTSCAAHDH